MPETAQGDLNDLLDDDEDLGAVPPQRQTIEPIDDGEIKNLLTF